MTSVTQKLRKRLDALSNSKSGSIAETVENMREAGEIEKELRLMDHIEEVLRPAPTQQKGRRDV